MQVLKPEVKSSVPLDISTRSPVGYDRKWKGGPSARCNNKILDNRVIAAHCVATATIVEELVVLFQVEHVVD